MVLWLFFITKLFFLYCASIYTADSLFLFQFLLFSCEYLKYESLPRQQIPALTYEDWYKLQLMSFYTHSQTLHRLMLDDRFTNIARVLTILIGKDNYSPNSEIIQINI